MAERDGRNWSAVLHTAKAYSGSDVGLAAEVEILSALRERDQLCAARASFHVTADEMIDAWVDTHNREYQEPTREALNAILAARGAPSRAERALVALEWLERVGYHLDCHRESDAVEDDCWEIRAPLRYGSRLKASGKTPLDTIEAAMRAETEQER